MLYSIIIIIFLLIVSYNFFLHLITIKYRSLIFNLRSELPKGVAKRIEDFKVFTNFI